MAKAFYDGLKEAGREDVVLLTRCGWAGNAKYGTLLWSGDVNSTFGSLKTQVMQGLNMGIAGIPWWNTDIGGFMTDDYQDPAFIELLLRWFEFAVFSPIVRLHGTRGPLDVPPLSDLDYGGGYLYTGHDNEIWSYGDKAQATMEKYLKIREEMKPYLERIYQEASDTGLPLMRAMSWNFRRIPAAGSFGTSICSAANCSWPPCWKPEPTAGRCICPQAPGPCWKPAGCSRAVRMCR